jgi:hypothetical protein
MLEKFKRKVQGSNPEAQSGDEGMHLRLPSSSSPTLLSVEARQRLLLVLLGNIVEGQSGSHIDDTMEELVPLRWPTAFVTEAEEVISRRRTQTPVPS